MCLRLLAISVVLMGMNQIGFAKAYLAVQGIKDSFGRVELDKRCHALVHYTESFSSQHLNNKLQVRGCAESNGVGGPLYSVDLGTAGIKDPQFRIDLTISDKGTAEIRMCDIGQSQSACTKPGRGVNLEFLPPKDAPPQRNALEYLRSLHKKAEHLPSNILTWVTTGPKRLRIFGQNYREFIRGLLKAKKSFPYPTKDKLTALAVELKPEKKGRPEAGSVHFTGEVDKAFLQCFGCEEVSCLSGLNYRFKNRFVHFYKAKDPTKNAGWVIETEDPMNPKSPWKYMCGVSRYSLQNMIAP